MERKQTMICSRVSENRRNRYAGICILLIALTLCLYWPVHNYDFIRFDEEQYVTNNPHVLAGLTRDGMIWSFGTLEAGFWHPLTWLSLMADSDLYGTNAGGYHWTNVLLHLANTLLLFLVLSRMTGAVWRSGFVAALFALHPLHVESVAWVAQRKDVLSGFFWMLATGAYVLYAERPGTGRYLLVLLLLILGLMSKPMLVTLPFVFLLLDYWPLGRFRDSWQGPVLEKIPMIAVAALFAIISYVAEDRAGALPSLAKYSLMTRLSNAVVSYGLYLVKTVWPFQLAVFYPHPEVWPVWSVLGSGVFLLAVSLAAVYWLKKYPYLSVGWFWYLGVLVPVTGLIQVGSHSMADRYTYLPLIGIFVMMVWGGADIAMRLKLGKHTAALFGMASLILLMSAAHFQVQTWRDSKTLYGHALEATDKNYLAYSNLAAVYIDEGKIGLAQKNLQEAIKIKPHYPPAHYNLGVCLYEQGRLDEAVPHFEEAVLWNPSGANALFALGDTLLRKGDYRGAASRYREALSLMPHNADAHNNLGIALMGLGRSREAAFHFREALLYDPAQKSAKANLDKISKIVNTFVH